MRTSTPTSEFHRAIYAASHNTFLAEQAAGAAAQVAAVARRLQLRVRNRVGRSFEEHQDIIDALREGDAEKAVVAVRNHARIVQASSAADLLAGIQQLERSALVASAAA